MINVSGVKKTIRETGLLLCVALMSIAVFSSRVYAQTSSHTGRLQGVVEDPSGAVVPGAKITLVKAATGTEETKETGSDGSFMFPALEPGNYRITVFKAGFAQLEIIDFPINVGTTAN